MLEKIFKSHQIKKDKDDLLKWGKDWTDLIPNPSLIVFPECEEQIIQLINLAIDEKLKIVPSGGRTGLSGGAVAMNREIILSLDKMNKILDFDSQNRILKCESGVITKEIQEFALKNGLFYPVDFASSGSSQIGGNVATNAGGIRVIRYGSTRDWISDIKIVNGVGEIMSFNNGLVKNASGYDLRHLMIGSEGTLGVITEVSVKFTNKPLEQNVMLLGLSDSSKLTQCLELFSDKLLLSAFEFFSLSCLRKVRSMRNVVEPFKEDYNYYALLEFDTNLINQAENAFLDGLKAGILSNGIISNSEAQVNQLWSLRENITESISAFNPVKNDISLRIGHIPIFLKDLKTYAKKFEEKIELCLFGHIGDGNIHINILKASHLEYEEFLDITQEISEFSYKKIYEFGGSISAEHGVGLLKKDYLKYTRSEEEIRLMKGIKNIFDPHGIFNPGKIF